RLATLEGNALSVYSLPEERLLASARLPEGDASRTQLPVFLSNDLVRVVLRRGVVTPGSSPFMRASLFELSVPPKRLELVASLDGAPGEALPPRALTLSGSDRFLFVEGKGERIALHDSRGALLSTLYA